MQYMVRTEMHGASGEMYERLHVAMAFESFSHFLTSDASGKKSKMPTGTYWIESSANAHTILAAAKRAVLPIDPSAEIVVSGGPQLVYHNCADAAPEYPLSAIYAALIPQPSPTLLTSSLFSSTSGKGTAFGSLLGQIPEGPSAPESRLYGALFDVPFKG